MGNLRCGEVMSVKPDLEATTCYKCDTDIVAVVGQVHPLCEDCQSDFDDWFTKELGLFSPRES